MDDRYTAGAPGRSKKRCAHPGCRALLLRGRVSFDLGFCAQHVTADRQPAAPRSHDVRSAVVVTTSSCGGEAYRSMLVSLPREPWVTPGMILPVGVPA